MPLTAMPRAEGFTLIELVIVMLIISFGLLGLTGMFTTAATSLTANEMAQKLTQYAQECAEKVTATRRNDTLGFAAPSLIAGTVGTPLSAICNTPTDAPAGTMPLMDSGFARTVVIADVIGTGTPCPLDTSVNCKTVTITATKSGQPSTVIDVMLVKF